MPSQDAIMTRMIQANPHGAGVIGPREGLLFSDIEKRTLSFSARISLATGPNQPRKSSPGSRNRWPLPSFATSRKYRFPTVDTFGSCCMLQTQ